MGSGVDDCVGREAEEASGLGPGPGEAGRGIQRGPTDWWGPFALVGD
ncbi:protein of unknown function [Streptomyces sp. KY75]|nr:protein of unknown function [Streptomyces sp. KY75]CAD5988236.1 protein of unknown function [Streptomyces sp. KY70]